MITNISPALAAGLRAGAAALLLACAGCSSLAPQSTTAAPPNGAILSRAPCQVSTDAGAFAKALDDYYKDDILQANLAPELAAQPLHTIFTLDENRRLAAAARDGRCERVVYSSSGLRVAGFVLRPVTPGPHPVLFWLRGGNRDFGRIEPVTLLNLKALADAGFVVVASQYRGADGGDGADEFGGADVDDVLALLPLARSLPGADADRLYLLGGSRGAMQGMLAMRRGLPVRAAAFRGGLYDLKSAVVQRPQLGVIWKELMPDQKAGMDQALERRSAVLWAGEVRAPILILHGRQDWRARLDEAQAFKNALATAGVPHKMVVYERDEHQLALHRTQWLDEVVQWFRAHGAFQAGPIQAGPIPNR